MHRLLVNFRLRATDRDFGVDGQIPDFDIAAAVDEGEDAGAVGGPAGAVDDVFAGELKEGFDGLLGAAGLGIGDGGG